MSVDEEALGEGGGEEVVYREGGMGKGDWINVQGERGVFWASAMCLGTPIIERKPEGAVGRLLVYCLCGESDQG